MEKIFIHNGKTITDKKIEDIYVELGYVNTCLKVEELVNKGILIPKKNAKTNGRKPFLYMKYDLIKPVETFDEEMSEIRKLNACLSTEYYLKNPKQYKKDRDVVLEINEFFIYNYNSLKDKMSINERSYEIFGKEKNLRDVDIKRILNQLNITEEKLNIYYTPEPFMFFVNNHSCNNIFIIENKDTWYSIKEILEECDQKILGLEIGTLIYGEGKKILNSYEYFNSKAMSYLKEPNIYYWGDIDNEGINIFTKLKKEIEVKLFVPAYEKMLDRYNKEKLQDMNENQVKMEDYNTFLTYFNEEYTAKINEVLDNKKYLPQEIINYRVFKEV